MRTYGTLIPASAIRAKQRPAVDSTRLQLLVAYAPCSFTVLYWGRLKYAVIAVAVAVTFYTALRLYSG